MERSDGRDTPYGKRTLEEIQDRHPKGERLLR